MASIVDTSRTLLGAFGLLVATACSGAPDPLALPAAMGESPEVSGLDGGADTASLADASVDRAPSEGATRIDSSQPAGDGGLDAAGDGSTGAQGLDGGVPGDAADGGEGGAPRASCAVSFTVADAFIDGVVDTGVAIGGDTAALGDWDPTAAIPMTSIGTGAWTVSLVMNDGDAVQFRFVKLGPGSFAWEDWGVNSNRSLVVSCSPDGDAGAADAGGPVVGTSYAGDFGVKPPDAT